jgi:hypothetical protein
MSRPLPRSSRFLLTNIALFFLISLCPSFSVALAAPGPAAKITFRRIFQGSSPEFIEIAVRDDSNTATFEIRQLDEDPGSQPFEVSDTLRTKIFALTGELNHFQGQDLDVHRKIANLGEKTFRWEQGAVSHETKFNYTLNSSRYPVATDLRRTGPPAGALCPAYPPYALRPARDLRRLAAV